MRPWLWIVVIVMVPVQARAESIVLVCSGEFKTITKLTIDDVKNEIAIEFLQINEKYMFVNGKTQNICVGKCGMMSLVLAPRGVSENVVIINDNLIGFAGSRDGDAMAFRIDRTTGIMSTNNPGFGTSLCARSAGKVF